MQVHLTAAAIELQDKQTQSARESLSVHEFHASNIVSQQGRYCPPGGIRRASEALEAIFLKGGAELFLAGV